MADLSDATARYIEAIEKAANATTEAEKNKQLAIAKQIKDTDGATRSLGNLNRSSGMLGDAFNTAGRSTAQLANTMLAGKADFQKFGLLLGDAGKDIGDSLKKNGGMVGQLTGTLVAALGTLAKAIGEQSQAAINAKDDLGQLGTAGKLTAKDVLDLATQAGYSSQTIAGFNNGVKAAGTGLLTLGKNTAEGVKKFSEIAAVGDDTIAAFRDMGISQAKLTEIQGNYINNISAAGRSIESFGKNEAERTQNLKKSSLEYASNLVALAGLTGKSVEQMEKEQKAATASVDFQLSQMAIQKEANEKRKAGDEEGAKALEEELKKRQAIVEQITATQGAEAGAAIRSAFATGGAITEQSEMLAKAGIDVEKIIASTRDRTITANQAADKATQLYSEGIQKTIDNLGPAAIYSADVAKQFGINLDTIKRINEGGLNFEKNAEAYRKEIKDKQDAAAKAAAEGKDPAEVARRALEETQRKIAKEMDEALLGVNPILRGFKAIGEDSEKVSKGLKAIMAAALINAGADVAKGTNPVTGNAIGAAPTGKSPPTRTGQAVKAAGLGIASAGAEVAGDAANEAGYEQAGSGLKVAGGALEGAGIGRLLGIIHPALGAIGAAAGAAYGGIKAFIEENAKSGGTEKRHGGTLGMTGELTEPKNTIAELQKGEMVLTAQQQKDLFSSGGAMTEDNAMMARSGIDVEKLMQQMKDARDKAEPVSPSNNTSDALSMVLTTKFDEMISKLDQMLAKSSDANDELKNSNRTLSDLLQYTRA
jgi:hypothetical protein